MYSLKPESGEYEAFAELVRRLDPQSKLLRIWQLKGGVSAQVTGLEIEQADGSTKKMVARRHGAANRRRNPWIADDEFQLLQLVRKQGIVAPTPYLLEDSGTIFGIPCLVMEYIEGKTEFAPNNLEDYLYQLSDHLARIHRVRGDHFPFLPPHNPVFEEYTAPLDDALNELRIRDRLELLWPIPRLNESVLLHGDFWPGNTLWQDGNLVGVIDWEDAAVGDPLADVANARLEILWAFGSDAMDKFTSHHASTATLQYFYLPYWDLCAALRHASKIGGWGLDAETERDMREKHQWFVAQALERLELSRD